MSNPGGQNPFGPGPRPQVSQQQYPNQQQQWHYQQQAPGPGGVPGGFPLQPKKKKRWPWVLGGVLLTFVLLLGGCFYVVNSAFQSIEDLGTIEGEIEGVVTTMFVDANNGNYASAGTAADGEGGCVTAEALTQQLTEVGPTSPATITRSAFFARNGPAKSYKNADEDFVVDGRRTSSAGRVLGTIETATGIRSFTVLLIDGSSGWKVCEVSVQ